MIHKSMKKESRFIPLGVKKRVKKIKGLWMLLIGLCFLGSQTAVAQETGKRVTLDLQEVTMKAFVGELQRQTGYAFFYKEDVAALVEPVTVSVEDADLSVVLEEVLGQKGCTFTFEGETVVIQQRAAQAQQVMEMTIRGVVEDTKGVSLPGVTVMVKGTTLGTSTDMDGCFELNLPKREDISLLFSFIGMKSQELAYAGEEELHVVMEEEVTEMNEVVVTGIFERKAESFTGSTATYKTEDLKMMGSQSVLQSLRTLDPSFHITPNNEFGSDPNKLPDIDIRGKTSIVNLGEEYETDPNQPLFILDGFEVGLQTIVDLNMDRVASVTILKDAASTAIYGSRAANGVVVVETKRPAPGTLRLSYNGDFQVQMPDLGDYNMMNAVEKLEFERLTGWYSNTQNDEYLVDRDNLYNQRLRNVQSGVDTYWLSEPVRTGFSHKHNLYVEGGDDAMLYGVGVSYNGTEGVMKQSTRDVLSFNIDLRYRKGQFSFDNKFTLDYTESQNPPQSFSVYVQTNPYYSKDFEGDIPKYLEETVIDGGTQTIRVSNPLYNGSLNYIDGTKETGFRNNFQLEWRPDEALRLRGRISINKSNSKDEYFKSPFHTDFDNVEKTERGSYSKSTNEQWGYDGDVTITYGKLLGEMHQVNAVAGWNFSSTKNINDSYTAIGFPDDNVSNPAFSNTYAENSKPTYSESTSRSTSFYLNGNYSYNNRYLFDINVRADGSSVFGINKRFTTSWSVGLAWNIHNENFVGDWADWLKLRFSVGNPGNQNFSAYKAYTTYVYNTSLQNAFDMGANVSEHGNPDLEWQKTMDYNVGFDLAVLNNRLKVNTDFYLKDTDPMLVNTSIASSTGRTSFTTNLGAQRTKGLSFNVVGMPIQNTEKQLTWSITLNGRHQVQTYRNIGNSLDLLNDELQGTSLVRYRDGGSPTDIWAVRSAGIDPMFGEEIYIKKNGLLTFEYDVNDEVIVGNTEPMLEGVVGSNLYYKGFTVSAYFRYRINADYFNSELYNRIENIQTSYVTAYNQDKRALYDRWQKPGDHAQYKRITNTIANNTTAPMTSRYVQKENSFSGESISMSYDFRNQKWLEKVFLESLTLRANLNDIFYSSTIRAERGTSYPFARTVSFTVNMTF